MFFFLFFYKFKVKNLQLNNNIIIKHGNAFFYLLGVNFLFYLFIYSFYSHDRGA